MNAVPPAPPARGQPAIVNRVDPDAVDWADLTHQVHFWRDRYNRPSAEREDYINLLEAENRFLRAREAFLSAGVTRLMGVCRALRDKLKNTEKGKGPG